MGKPSKGAAIRTVDPKVVEFIEAAAVGDLRLTSKLIKAGNVEIDDDVDGVTALMRACGNGHMKVIEELLLGQGAGMWCMGPSYDPMTPFMWAAHYGQLEVVRYFVEEIGMDDLGMNTGAGKSGNKTAMDFALDAGQCDEETVAKKFDVQAYLLEKGAKYGEGVTDPQTVFDGAARGDERYVHFCLEANGEMVHARYGVERSSLLHVAANTGSLELTKILISHKADMEARDVLNRTPLMSAAIAGQVDVVRFFFDQGVTLESRDATGNTALHHACEAGYLECVRALLCRDVPAADTEDAEAMAVTKAMLSGDASESRPPPRQLSPCEMLQMKNKSGHTPIIKAFAGGVHVDVIRYVVGAMDGNVDPIRAGQLCADPHPVLSRQLSTDGIDLVPLPPVEEDSAGQIDKSAAGGGIFSCAVDEDEGKEEQPDEKANETEEMKEEVSRRDLAPGGAFPVRVPPGPATLGHRRFVRFLDTMTSAIWGFDADKVCVMSRDAFLSQEKVIDHRAAKKLGMLVSLMEVPPRANVLYVVHRWSGPGQPDSASNDAYMQLKRYLEEPAGENIHYVWIDASCLDVNDRENVSYDQYIVNVMSVISRSTHLLALSPCKKLDPVALIHSMVMAKMSSIGSLKTANTKQATPAGLGSHVPGAGEVAHVFAATTRHRKGTSAMIERVVTGAVDVAIAARKEIDPEKWALVPTVASASNGEASNGSLPAVEDKEKDKGGVEGVADVPANGVTGGGTGVGGAGGGKAVPPASQVSGGVVGIGADKGGGSTVPTRKSSVGGVASGPKAPRSGTREDASKRKSSTGNKGGSEEMALASHAGFEGLTKKERKALEEQRAMDNAAMMAAEVVEEIGQTSAFIVEPVYYSDPVALLNRGWVEMEISMALILGVQVHVAVRWGPKVSFQTVLVKPVRAGDGEGEAQAVGFRGAFVQAIERIAPEPEIEKGWWVELKRNLKGAEPTADPARPVAMTLKKMLERCHEPQTVVPPLVRAALALHDERALLPFLAGELSPVQVMYQLSGLALQDVKDGFSGLGPISTESDRVSLVRLYLMGLSYAMGIVQRGTNPAGKPRWQLERDLVDAAQRIQILEDQVAQLRQEEEPAAVEAQEPPPVVESSGCNCVVM